MYNASTKVHQNVPLKIIYHKRFKKIQDDFIDRHPHRDLWNRSLHLNRFVCQISFSFLLQTLETRPSGSLTNTLIALKHRKVKKKSKNLGTRAYLLKLIH